jgi:hypothetical protein
LRSKTVVLTMRNEKTGELLMKATGRFCRVSLLAVTQLFGLQQASSTFSRPPSCSPDKALRSKVFPSSVFRSFMSLIRSLSGMGMELYDSAPAGSPARVVWDSAESYFRANWGFSILQLVRQNPQRLTVSFDGPEGKAIRYVTLNAASNCRSLPALRRANYASIVVDNDAKESVPLFPEAHNPGLGDSPPDVLYSPCCGRGNLGLVLFQGGPALPNSVPAGERHDL